MKEVTKIETIDGRLFDTVHEAREHEQFVEFSKWYEDNKIYGSYEGCKIEWEDFWEWVKENRAEVKKMLKFV